jgi:hypothetical protein
MIFQECELLGRGEVRDGGRTALQRLVDCGKGLRSVLTEGMDAGFVKEGLHHRKPFLERQFGILRG